jgi:hypothetical protein
MLRLILIVDCVNEYVPRDVKMGGASPLRIPSNYLTW